MIEQLTMADAAMPFDGSNWIITRRGPRARKCTVVAKLTPGAEALRKFHEECDTGAPGAYFLHGMAARQTHELSCAKVQDDEFEVYWQPAWILFSLGAKGMTAEVIAAVEYLRSVGAWPKEEA